MSAIMFWVFKTTGLLVVKLKVPVNNLTIKSTTDGLFDTAIYLLHYNVTDILQSYGRPKKKRT